MRPQLTRVGSRGSGIELDRRCRRQAVVLLVAAALLPGSAGPAVADSARPGPLGGDLLGRRDTVVLRQPGAPAPPANISASGWLLADLDTGAVLAAHDAHGRYAPASTLKTLTALALIPRLHPKRVVTATAADVSVDGSKVGLVPGQRYRIDQLFTALLVVSSNDAANTLAAAAGGAGHAVALMNQQAVLVQAGDTTARTVSGLDAAGQASSAYDLALIGRAAMRLGPFRRYVAIRRSYIPAPGGRRIEIDTHNKLLRNYPGAIGIKNGYTAAAGATFIGAATRGGRTLEVTLLHANPLVWHEAAALLDWGFAAGARLSPVGQLVEPLPAGGSQVDAPPSTPVPSTAARTPASATAGPAVWWGLPPRRLLALAAGCLLAAVAVGLRRRSRRRFR